MSRAGGFRPRRPEFVGGPRDGEQYRRAVADGERLVVLAYDALPGAPGYLYALAMNAAGRAVLRCLGTAPPLPPEWRAAA